ncbi:hypothetical protein PC1101_12270 [Streptococcus pneumoniae]|nr:hypothetical protein PC1101_12270 [Streptococcus pneumoniae]
MQKNIYFVVLDLHTTDRDKIIQLFKDWTDDSWAQSSSFDADFWCICKFLEKDELGKQAPSTVQGFTSIS